MTFEPEFFTGFEGGLKPTRAGTFVGGTGGGSGITANAHTGAYAMRTSAGFLWAVVLGSRSEWYGTVWLHLGSLGDTELQFYPNAEGSDRVVTLRYAPSSCLWSAYRGVSTLLATGTVRVPTNEYHRLSFHIVVDDAAGVFQTRIDGIPDIDYGGNTQPGAGSTICRFEWRAFTTGNSSCIDDLAIGAGGWPGDLRVDGLVVTGDVGAPEFERSAGDDNYALVDEVPASTDDYVYTEVDAEDIYTVEDWDDTGKTPVAVQVWLYAQKADAGSDDQIRVRANDGVNEVNGDYESLLTTWEHRWKVLSTAPDGGAWTDEDVDALQVGMTADME